MRASVIAFVLLASWPAPAGAWSPAYPGEVEIKTPADALMAYSDCWFLNYGAMHFISYETIQHSIADTDRFCRKEFATFARLAGSKQANEIKTGLHLRAHAD
jgi:hypothetical protein